MPPKYQERIRASLEANASIAYSDRNVPRLGGVQLASSRGVPTRAGRFFKQLAPTYNRSTALDPWIRGTYTRGQREYAKRLSGEEVIVGNWSFGNLLPTIKNGESYYGQFREEYLLEVPVLRYPTLRDSKGRWIDTGGPAQLQMLPLSSLTLEGTDGIKEYPSAPRLRAMSIVRDRENAPLTREEK